MAQATVPPAPEKTRVRPLRIELPEDRIVELFVVQQATNLSIHKEHTKDAYENGVLRADVKSLSNGYVTVDESHSRRLKAKQDAYGSIRKVKQEKRVIRAPPWLVVFSILFGVLALVTYGQSSPIVSSQFFYLVNFYGADIAVGIILIIALAFFLRRKRKAKP